MDWGWIKYFTYSPDDQITLSLDMLISGDQILEMLGTDKPTSDELTSRQFELRVTFYQKAWIRKLISNRLISNKRTLKYINL